MLRKKWVWVVVVLLALAGIAATVFSRRQDQGIRVSAETIQRRDLEAIVSASGKIEPQKTVNISAQSMGRVTRLAVNEGDRVKAGQFLLQIDAVNAEAAVRRDEAAVAGARTALEQSRVVLQSARASLELARQSLKRQQDLTQSGLTTRESLEKAQAEVEVRESDLHAREQEIKNRETQLRQQEAGLQSSQHSLSQVRFEAPFDGIVTRRNIEEGENVVVGTMNNAGTMLLTVADMSVIEAEIEVDETDIPFVQLGQPARITIDAIPDKTFTGKVTEIGNSPIQTTATAAHHGPHGHELQGDGDHRRIRCPTCARASPARRRSRRRRAANVMAVPIQALTVRELLYDEQGNGDSGDAPAQAALPVRRPRRPPPRATPPPSCSRARSARKPKACSSSATARPRSWRSSSASPASAIWRCSSGLKEGDRVITGPFESVRGMFEGDTVQTGDAKDGGAAATGGGVRVRVGG